MTRLEEWLLPSSGLKSKEEASNKSLTIKMEAVYSPKTLVNFYQTTWCHIPDNGTLHSHHCETLNTHTKQNFLYKYILVSFRYHLIVHFMYSKG
jgi:hypothetical protein